MCNDEVTNETIRGVRCQQNENEDSTHRMIDNKGCMQRRTGRSKNIGFAVERTRRMIDIIDAVHRMLDTNERRMIDTIDAGHRMLDTNESSRRHNVRTKITGPAIERTRRMIDTIERTKRRRNRKRSNCATEVVERTR